MNNDLMLNNSISQLTSDTPTPRAGVPAEMTQRIFDYLQTNTTAGDTLEGIARWWLLAHELDSTLALVQKALRRLKQQGLVVEFRTPNQRPLYFVQDGQEG